MAILVARESGRTTVEIPDVVGKSSSEAETLAERRGVRGGGRRCRQSGHSASGSCSPRSRRRARRSRRAPRWRSVWPPRPRPRRCPLPSGDRRVTPDPARDATRDRLDAGDPVILPGDGIPDRCLRRRSRRPWTDGCPACASRAPTNAAGCAPTSSRASCSPPSSCPRAWPTPSWPACRPSPASTRPSPAWSATPIFGPSRVLVLGPDSSVSPLIFAAIMPLLAGGDPATAIALAGMLALLVGLIEIGLGLGKLGFVADLLSSEVQVGYMNGLAHHDHRRPAAEAVRLLDRRRRRSSTRCGRSSENLDQTSATTLAVGLACSCVLLVLPRFTRTRPGRARGRRRRHDRVGRPRARRARASTTVGVAAAGRSRRRPCRGRSCSDVGPLLVAAIGITLVSLTDTIADRDELRRAARRRGRARPGDDRHRRREHRRRVLPGLRGVDQRVAHRGGRAVGRQEPGHRPRRRRRSSPCSCCSSTRCSPTCRSRRWPRW